MKARYTYPLLFLLPAAMAALIFGVLVAAAGGGVLWLFVYGDSAWPAGAGRWVMALATAAALSALLALLLASHRFGRQREDQGGLLRAHVLVALAVSLGLPLLVLLHQWQVGNLGSGAAPSSGAAPVERLPGAG